MNEDAVRLAIEFLALVVFIFLGVRSGGIGLGLWGGVGVLFFAFVLQEPPGEPPISAMLIIIAVISAAAAMQAAGGTDFLVKIASRIIRSNPKQITIIAPLVSYVFTVGAGTSNIYFSLIPVIEETAYANGIRPERPLAASTVAGGLGITSSPVSAAMAVMVGLMEPLGFSLAEMLVIIIPATLVAIVAGSFFQQRIGKELKDDPEYQRRLAAGEIQAVSAASAIEDKPLPPRAALSAYIFLAGVAGHRAARPVRAASAGLRDRSGRVRAARRHDVDPDGHADRRDHHPDDVSDQPGPDPEGADLHERHDRNDRPLRHRLDGRHVRAGEHRLHHGTAQRHCDRGSLPAGGSALRDGGIDDEPIGDDEVDRPDRNRARPTGPADHRDVAIA